MAKWSALSSPISNFRNVFDIHFTTEQRRYVEGVIISDFRGWLCQNSSCAQVTTRNRRPKPVPGAFGVAGESILGKTVLLANSLNRGSQS